MNDLDVKNGKYYTGKITDPNEYRGWFCGTFMKEGHPGKTEKLEIKYASHKRGEKEKNHYHKVMIEVVIYLEGKVRVKINDEELLLGSGDFIFVDRNNTIFVEYLEDTKLIAIHSPSLTEEESDEVAVD